jgi:cell division control protein 7
VLWRVPDQTVALDIWSAGIIFLCILSHRYPFFSAPDDETALAEVNAFFGDPDPVKSKSVDRVNYMVDCNGVNAAKGVHIPDFCRESSGERWPQEAFDLLLRCLDYSPSDRISAGEALAHPFFKRIVGADVKE